MVHHDFYSTYGRQHPGALSRSAVYARLHRAISTNDIMPEHVSIGCKALHTHAAGTRERAKSTLSKSAMVTHLAMKGKLRVQLHVNKSYKKKKAESGLSIITRVCAIAAKKRVAHATKKGRLVHQVVNREFTAGLKTMLMASLQARARQAQANQFAEAHADPAAAAAAAAAQRTPLIASALPKQRQGVAATHLCAVVAAA